MKVTEEVKEAKEMRATRDYAKNTKKNLSGTSYSLSLKKAVHAMQGINLPQAFMKKYNYCSNNSFAKSNDFSLSSS